MRRLFICLTAGAAMLVARPLLAAPAGGEQDVGSALLTPDVMSAVWNLVMFLVLFAILAKFVWPRILEALRTREERLQSDLASAEQARAEAQQALEQYRQQLGEAQQEARQMIDQARQDAEQLRGKMLADAEAELKQIRQRATEDIELAKRQAVQELYTTSAELATQVAEKILQRQINEQDTQRLVEQSLEELSRAGNN